MKCTRAKSPGYPQKGGCSLIRWLQTYLLIVEKVQPYLKLIDMSARCTTLPPNAPATPPHPITPSIHAIMRLRVRAATVKINRRTAVDIQILYKHPQLVSLGVRHPIKRLQGSKPPSGTWRLLAASTPPTNWWGTCLQGKAAQVANNKTCLHGVIKRQRSSMQCQ